MDPRSRPRTHTHGKPSSPQFRDAELASDSSIPRRQLQNKPKGRETKVKFCSFVLTKSKVDPEGAGPRRKQHNFRLY